MVKARPCAPALKLLGVSEMADVKKRKAPAKTTKKTLTGKPQKPRIRTPELTHINKRPLISLKEAAAILNPEKPLSANAMTKMKARGALSDLYPKHGTRKVYSHEVVRLAKIRNGGVAPGGEQETAAEKAARSSLQRKRVDILKYHAKLRSISRSLLRSDVVIDDLALCSKIIGESVGCWQPDFLEHMSADGVAAFDAEIKRIKSESARELSAVVENPIDPLEDEFLEILVVPPPITTDKISLAKAILDDIKSQIAMLERCKMLLQVCDSKVALFKSEAAATTLQGQIGNIQGRTANHIPSRHRVGIRGEIVDRINSIIDEIRAAMPGSTAAESVCLGLTPPPAWTVSQWADERRVLSSVSSGAAGKWQTSFTPYLREPMDVVTDPEVTRVSLMFCAQSGKALALDTPIATPGGWVAMGDLKAGDQVFGADGKPTPVVAVSPIWRDRDCYRVTFRDGTTIVADSEHEWPVDGGKTSAELAGCCPPVMCAPASPYAALITAIEPVESQATVCIQVAAGDHLFLAGEGMVPTHNSELLLNVLGYFADLSPGPAMVLQPTLEMAEQFTRDRVTPMFIASPSLARKLDDSNTAGKTAQQARLKSFSGGYIVGVGANSPASLASRPIRILVADEVDRYPISAGSEGSPLLLAEKRTISFAASASRKIIATSTPTIKGISVIERLYDSSDRRRLFCPCQHCQAANELEFENIVWEKGSPATAAYACPECGVVWTDADRMKAVSLGEWIATRPQVKGHAGFFVSALHSPFYTCESIIEEYETAYAGGSASMRVFTNTVLGEPYRDDSTTTTDESLINRMDSSIVLGGGEPVPANILALTCGVDVQQDRLEATVMGWKRPPAPGALPVPVILTHRIFTGNVDDAESWAALSEFLQTEWQHELGNKIEIDLTCVDSGNWASRVYDYTDSQPRTFSVKGVASEGKALTRHSKSKRKGRSKPLIIVGTHEAKDRISSGWLNATDHPAYVQIAQIGDAGENAEWAKQALSEYREIKFSNKGNRTEWVRKPGSRAEVLDCMVYAHAAMSLINPNWDARENDLTRIPDDDGDGGWVSY
jgi:phage terminase large subunit GpA-like protein